MKKGFPEVVLQVLKDLENNDKNQEDKNNSDLLSSMRKLTQNKAELIRMWNRVLKAQRTELYKNLIDTEIVHCFLGIITESNHEKLPAFYLSEKKKKGIIKKILGHEERIRTLYQDTLAEEAHPFIESLCINISAALNKIDESYLRARGTKKIRVIHSFIREVAQRSLFIYKEQPNSVIRSAVLAIYNHTINSDVNIIQITKGEAEKPICSIEFEHLIFRD